MSQMNIKRKIYDICSKEDIQQNFALLYTPQARSPFWLLKPASEIRMSGLLPRRSWSWIVLLPNGAHRKHITSIKAVLRPFIIYLPTLPRILLSQHTRYYSRYSIPAPFEYNPELLPHFPDNRLTDGGEVVSLIRRPPLTPRKIHGTHFC
jgi:hypothetical protein